MITQILSLPDFLAKFNFKKVSFKDFSSSLRVLRNSKDGEEYESVDDYISRHPSRGRKERALLFKKNLYRMIVEEPEKTLSVWYDRWVSLPHPISYYFEFPNTIANESGVFYGAIHGKYGKVCRAINFEVAHNTVKTNGVDNGSDRLVMTDLKLMFDEFSLHYRLLTPAMFDMVCDIDEWGYKEFWKHLMLYLNKPSILNPYVYREILNELFDGETLFAPCMSWNSCQVAFYNSHFNHFISTDVIPSVVENGRNLHLDWQDWNDSRVVIFPDEKTVDLYCCPSEQLQKRHKFIDKYRNKVDAVLFCPPYFDLELYDSPEQSVDSFPDYLDWLRGYWEETVKICVEVMRPGARFGFIISNYARNIHESSLVPVSNDMSNIVSKHLTLIKRYTLQWNKPVQKRVSAKMKEGHVEDIWLFEKRV